MQLLSIEPFFDLMVLDSGEMFVGKLLDDFMEVGVLGIGEMVECATEIIDEDFHFGFVSYE